MYIKFSIQKQLTGHILVWQKFFVLLMPSNHKRTLTKYSMKHSSVNSVELYNWYIPHTQNLFFITKIYGSFETKIQNNINLKVFVKSRYLDKYVSWQCNLIPPFLTILRHKIHMYLETTCPYNWIMFVKLLSLGKIKDSFKDILHVKCRKLHQNIPKSMY